MFIQSLKRKVLPSMVVELRPTIESFNLRGKMRFFYIMLWLVSFQSFSGEQYVFCANQEGTQWEWLPNDRTIDGYWIYRKIKGRAYFVTFRIEKQQYESLKAECINYFPNLQYPQPAESSFSDWRLFSFIEAKKVEVVKSKFNLFFLQPDCNCIAP